MRRGWAACLAALIAGCVPVKHHDDPPPVVGPDGQPFVSEDALNAGKDVVGYAKFCKESLGLPPDVLASWNCLDGLEVPTTIEGQKLTAANYAQLKGGQVGCDTPSWLGDEPCANYNFVQKRQLSPTVDAYLICRKRGFSTEKDKAARLADAKASLTPDTFDALYAFDSLGLIWTNPKTGQACFFDYVGKVYGGYVPSPDDERTTALDQLPSPKPPADYQADQAASLIWKKTARTTWRDPQTVVTQDNCVHCHDTGPLKGTPWIQQVMTIPPNDQSVTYRVIGSTFATWTKDLRAITTDPVQQADGTTAPQPCTGCHRIGNKQTCENTLYFASGKSLAAGKVSSLGGSFAHRVWMPPAPAAWAGKSEAELTSLWTAAYDKAVAKLKCCCDNPTAKGCYTQDFTADPLPAPTAGTGPALCP